ncbi:MAG: hypothetical protein HC923_09065 [Myxococcales bacterium]|nr:hypothetical protein [Myxococcales bacterium]
MAQLWKTLPEVSEESKRTAKLMEDMFLRHAQGRESLERDLRRSDEDNKALCRTVLETLKKALAMLEGETQEQSVLPAVKEAFSRLQTEVDATLDELS